MEVIGTQLAFEFDAQYPGDPARQELIERLEWDAESAAHELALIRRQK